MSEPMSVWMQAEMLESKLVKLDLFLSTFQRFRMVEELDQEELVSLLALASDLAADARHDAASVLTAAQVTFQQLKKAGLI